MFILILRGIDVAAFLTIALFAAGLPICIISGASIIWALLFGMVCFVGYSLYRGYSPREIAAMMGEGVAAYKNILIVFACIGMLTAVWRSAGTIPFIIYHAVSMVNAKYIVLSSFLLCGAMSVLTGTSFGTAGTVGVICMMTANSVGVEPMLAGGAILAGAFLGDRCSPMSTSAMLVSALTDTDIYKNIANMVKSSAVPLLLTCGFYAFAGRNSAGDTDAAQNVAFLTEHFELSFWAALPAVLVIILLLARVNVRWAMLSSVAVAVIVSVLLQNMSLGEVAETLLFGYRAADPRLGALINGGGIVSMIKVSLIITVSATYSGIFKRTGLLDGIKKPVEKLAKLITPFGAVTVVSIFMGMISCNQTLATTLTHQTTEDIISDKYEMALTLEDTVIVLAALVPWSIAGAVPLQTVGAPTSSHFAAVYLYLLPLCGWIFAIIKGYRGRRYYGNEKCDA